MDTSLLIAIATMGGLGFLFAGGLAFADRKLRVEENPLIGKINESLPGANCGACGKAGCYDFAVNVVDGKAEVNGCPVGGSDTAQELATLMGVETSDTIKMIPMIACKGGNQEAVKKMADYYGPLSCSAMDIVSGGNKLCYSGCLSGGDCITACPFDALIMGDNGIPEVIEEICTGCTVCVASCPKKIISMQPVDRSVFLYCSNHDDPKTAKGVCSVACLGCGVCARKTDGVEMDNYLPVIDYESVDAELIPYDKCKPGAITKLNRNESIN